VKRRGFLISGITAITAGAGIVEAAEKAYKKNDGPEFGNPILPGSGTCDPQIRVYDDVVYMYATHDFDAANSTFIMKDWRVWRSRDLVHWDLVSTLTPRSTYLKADSDECWATDAARKGNDYFMYFSMGPKNIGVVKSSLPYGPWNDPLGQPLIADGTVKTEARDPGILQDPDGSSYIVFGTFSYFIAKLNDDMTSLAEKPRRIIVRNAEGPYGRGITDDKPFLHSRLGKYYLSWGSYYAISDSPYGPYECKGRLFTEDNVDPQFLMAPAKSRKGVSARDWLNYDRHGSFFELHGQTYFACNDQSAPYCSPFFRNSVITYVHYREDGEIAPLELRAVGVGRYVADKGIRASDYFAAVGCKKREFGNAFVMQPIENESSLYFPNIQFTKHSSTLDILISTGENSSGSFSIEVHRDSKKGRLLAKRSYDLSQFGKLPRNVSLPVAIRRPEESLYMTIKGGSDGEMSIHSLSFSNGQT
jgi:hypothetical protein